MNENRASTTRVAASGRDATPGAGAVQANIWRDRLLYVVIFALAILPLFSTPVLPFVDLYNHLARYYVLAHIDGDPLLAANYAAHWSLLPNIGLDVVATPLLRLLPVALAAHALVIAIFAIQYSGLLYFNKALTGRASPLVALLVVPLLYSFVLNWGFANFLVGLGLVFWAAGWWLNMRHRLAIALPVACVLAVVLFLTHGLAFALYGILVGGLEVGLFLQSRPRRISELLRRLAPLLVQAVLPVVLFRLATTSQSSEGLTSADESIARLADAGALSARLSDLLAYRLTTILRVSEGPGLVFDALTLLAMAGIVGTLIARRRASIARAAWVAIAIAVLLVVVVPPAMFGVGYVADRMPLFLALLVVGALAAHRPADALQRRFGAALAAIVALRLVAIALDWQSYARDYAAFEKVAAVIPPGALVADLSFGGSGHDLDRPRCAMYRPMLISQKQLIGPLFANPTQQPLRLAGRLQAAMATMPRAKNREQARDPLFVRQTIAATMAAPGGFDYLLACNYDQLPGGLPASARIVMQTERFTLLGRETPAQ